jgi:uncharacterized protein (DUF58 family)
VETNELLRKVRAIEIKTRRISRNQFAGEYHSHFKGRGMAFSEVREYNYGDEIRNIDWKVTARYNHPYIKVYEEERELTVMLLVDVSGSRFFGTQQKFKRDLITEIAAILAFSAISNNDKVGMIMFSDQVEKYIPPKKGRFHILRIIRDLLEFEPKSKSTNITPALRHLTNVIKKRSIAFLLTDFMDMDPEKSTLRFEDALKIANRKHELVAVRIYDKRERDLPTVGMMKLKDGESGKQWWIDTSDPNVVKGYKKWWNSFDNALKDIFIRSGMNVAQIATSDDYIKPLIALFKRKNTRI